MSTTVTLPRPNGYNTDHWLYPFATALATSAGVGVYTLLDKLRATFSGASPVLIHEFAGGGWGTATVLNLIQKFPEYSADWTTDKDSLVTTFEECVKATHDDLFTFADTVVVIP